MASGQRGGTVHRQPSHDTVLELPGFGEDSPGYDLFRAQTPAVPHPSTSHHVPSPPAGHQVTSMHYSHYTHDERTERSENPTSHDPSEEEDDRHSTRKSAVAHSTHKPPRYPARHSTHHSKHPSTHQSNRSSSHKSDHSSPHPSPHPSHPQTALDGDTTLIHQTQNGEPEAVVVHPLPTSDYKSMGPTELSSSPSSPSATGDVNRIQKFVHDVHNMP